MLVVLAISYGQICPDMYPNVFQTETCQQQNFITCLTCGAGQYLDLEKGTCLPTESPTLTPSLSPTATPSLSPSSSPTLTPSLSPSSSLTATPSLSPFSSPTLSPSANQTYYTSSSETQEDKNDSHFILFISMSILCALSSFGFMYFSFKNGFIL